MVAANPLTAAPSDERIAPLEGVRGLMAWWVVLGHYAHTVGLTNPILENNALAVDVFVILSGFVITLLILRKREPYIPYLTRRAFRIFPAYLVILLISAALLPIFADAMRNIPFQSGRNIARLEQIEAAQSWFSMHLAVHLPLLQGLVPNAIDPTAPFTIVGQAWSISLEWQFYLVAPLVVALAGKKWGLPILAVIVAVLWWSASFMSIAYLGAKQFQFIVGIASCIGFVSHGGGRYRAFGVAIFAAFGCLVSQGWLQLLPLTIWLGCMVTVLSWRDWWPASMAAKVLSHPVLKWIGDRSYSTYLVHMLPIYLGAFALNATGIADGSYAAALLVIVVVGTVLLSMASFRLEKWGITAGRSIARKLS